MIEIDGSFGEGGGQILRTALSLSCLYLKPFRIFNIRKGRKKPGLMPQHLTGVRALQLLSNAEIKGAEIGSLELTFKPKRMRGGEFFFDVGTAGSTSLVLQTIIPPLIFAKEKAVVTLKGGTHVPFSPSYDYIANVFSGILYRIGVKIDLNIESYGFYPKGGGKVRADIFPAKEIIPLRITDRGRITWIKGYSGVGNLPLSIAERQRKAFVDKMQELKELKCPVDVKPMDVPSPGQGTFIYLQAESQNAIAGFSALGERGKRAEAVGEEAAAEFIEYYRTNAVFDKHLPDQLALYLSMSEEESVFTTSCITQHLMTNLWVIDLFHKFRYSVDGEIGKPGTVRVIRA